MYNRLGFNPPKRLSCMSNVTMQRKRAHSIWPEGDNVAESRGREMHKMRQTLGLARNPRNGALTPVAASSGTRAGGFESLRRFDTGPVYVDSRGEPVLDDAGGEDHEYGRSGSGKNLSSRTTPTVCDRANSSHLSFIAPEACTAPMERREAREAGGQPKSDEPVPVSARKDGTAPIIWTQAVWESMARIAVAAGLRDREQRGRRRRGAPATNGFRRLWNKACKESPSGHSPSSSPIKRCMTGHTGLVTPGRYYKGHVLKPAVEYMQSGPALTTVDAEILRLESIRRARRIDEAQDGRGIEIAAPRRIVEETARRGEVAQLAGRRSGRRSRAGDCRAESKRRAADT